MSKKPASMPVFGDAYLADTTHLTTEEHGAYFLLMLAAWRQPDCDLPNDDKKLARIAGLTPRKWQAVKASIWEFWTVKNGRIFQKRQQKEFGYVQQKSEANRKAAKSRWNSQPIENIEGDECERISERNAPPPPPTKKEKGEDKSSPKKKQVRGTPVPDDFTPIPTDSIKHILDGWPPGKLDRVIETFKDYHRNKGTIGKDWQAGFRTWVMNDDKFGNRNGGSAPQKSGDALSRASKRLDERLAAQSAEQGQLLELSGPDRRTG